jgi:hypothetical protein
MTDLNAYIDAERGNRYAAAQIKELEAFRVRAERMKRKGKRVSAIELMTGTWFTKDRRKDADNVRFAVTFILDGNDAIREHHVRSMC